MMTSHPAPAQRCLAHPTSRDKKKVKKNEKNKSPDDKIGNPANVPVYKGNEQEERKKTK